MTDHIDISRLESTLLAPGSLGDEEIARIRLHLESCALCRQNLESLQRFHRNVEQELSVLPSEADRQAAGRILPRGLARKTPEERIIEAYAEAVEPYKRPLAKRFIRFVNTHPYQSGGAFVAALAAIVVVLSLTVQTKDQNPTYAEIKNNVLYAYNKETEVIWKKGVPGLPDCNSRNPLDRETTYPSRQLSVDDVDGDGFNEILLVGSSLQGEFTNDTLYCFDRKGNLRWQAGTGPMISFGRQGIVRHNRPEIVAFLVMRRYSGARSQIFVLASEQIYSPTKLFEVNPKDGTILQSFFNRGGCSKMSHKDIDLDGKEELLIAGVNDGFNRACLAVFDPGKIGGCSPLPPNEMPPEGTGGQEEYYILFPRWQIQPDARRRLYNSVQGLVDLQGGGVDVRVTEYLADPHTGEDVASSLYFALGRRLSVDRIMADDTAIDFSQILYKEGKIKAPVTSATFASLKDSVLYWDGKKFVNTPTMNENYKTAASAATTPAYP
jgi:hypothetical protein